MRQRKWLAIPALIAVGSLVLLGVLMLLPTPKSGFEPDWLLKLPLSSDKRTVHRLSGPPITEVVVTQRTWNLQDSWPNVSDQLNKAFLASKGWRKEGFPGMAYQVWQRHDLKSGEGFTVAALLVDKQIRIQSHTSRPLTWLEGAQRSIRKFFGVRGA